MERARVFKFEDEHGNAGYVASFEETDARERIMDFTMKNIFLKGVVFLDDLPGYASRLKYAETAVIMNNIPPF